MPNNTVQRPAVTLALIAKNEEENIPQLFKSIEGCFDEIHLTDTGSTDATVEVATRYGARVHHFEWIDDFAAARNFAFSKVTTDFVMWLDLDDVLQNKEAFLKWRDNAMGLADYWLATYHYNHDEKGKPNCSFPRERVFRTKLQMPWKYFIHEGIIPSSRFGQVRANYISTWAVKHCRTAQDLEKDRSRNILIFQKHQEKLDSRMTYYYGKELFEAGKPLEATQVLMQAVIKTDLELHDRIMGLQYLCYALQMLNQMDKAREFALQGLQLAPHRAEFHTILGDSYVKTGQIQNSIPWYSSAKSCIDYGKNGQDLRTPIFTHPAAYTHYPRNQLARVYANMGDLVKAEKELLECVEFYPNEESATILAELQKVKTLQLPKPETLKKVDEIVFTCPPGPYEWDAEIEREKGVGGSETAAIHMAHWLRKVSGKPVKVFNQRQTTKTIGGVEYLPFQGVYSYFSQVEPRIHVAWRHNHPLTKAKTFFWCHDLMAMGGENTQNYEKLLCLSPFHKDYVQAMQGIPDEKILITRNGIDPSRFNPVAKVEKNPNWVIFPSSPDRGLDRAMRIMDRLIPEMPELELHVFYGFENMEKAGPQMQAEVAKLKGMIAERPWVKFHGNVQQQELAQYEMKSVVWLHPANFIETYCITAIEMLAAGTYPLTRRLGALRDTLASAEAKGMATLMNIDCETESEYDAWAQALKDVLLGKDWERVQIDPYALSWESLAKEWLQTFLKSEPMAQPQMTEVRGAAL